MSSGLIKVTRPVRCALVSCATALLLRMLLTIRECECWGESLLHVIHVFTVVYALAASRRTPLAPQALPVIHRFRSQDRLQ